MLAKHVEVAWRSCRNSPSLGQTEARQTGGSSGSMLQTVIKQLQAIRKARDCPGEAVIGNSFRLLKPTYRPGMLQLAGRERLGAEGCCELRTLADSSQIQLMMLPAQVASKRAVVCYYKCYYTCSEPCEGGIEVEWEAMPDLLACRGGPLKCCELGCRSPSEGVPALTGSRSGPSLSAAFWSIRTCSCHACNRQQAWLLIVRQHFSPWPSLRQLLLAAKELHTCKAVP